MDISQAEFHRVFRPIITILYGVALIPMVFRLAYRTWSKQLWWDDLWAGLALINAAALFIIFFFSSFFPNVSEGTANALYVLTLATANFALWSARLSVAVTIVRVIAIGTIRILAKAVAILFGLFSITLLTQRLIICGPPSSAKFLCSNPTLAGYTELVMSLSADLWLLSAPAYLLWKMNLRKKHHRLLQAIFACEVMVLVASTVHCVYMAKKIYLLQALTAHFEIAISLIVCNLLFLVTYIFRIFRQGGDSFDESTTSAPTRHPEALLTERNSTGTMISRTPTNTPLTSVFTSTSTTNSVEDRSIYVMTYPMDRGREYGLRDHFHHSF